MDKILGYDPKDASSILAIPTKNENIFYYAKTLRNSVKYLQCDNEKEIIKCCLPHYNKVYNEARKSSLKIKRHLMS